MNKQVAAVVGGVGLLAALFLGTAWYTGQVAHAQVDKFVEFTTNQYAGLVHVVARKSSNGVFNSVEDVTFAVDAPIALLIKSAAQIGATANPTASMAAQSLSKSDLQFTIHNVIAHGPLPGFKSVAMARIETSLLLDDATQHHLRELLGTDKPLSYVTTLNWLGGGTVELSSPAFRINRPADGVSVAWQGVKARLNFTRNAQQLTFSALAPDLIVSAKDNSQLHLTELRVDGHLQRKFENLYTGDESFSLASISFSPPMSMAQSGSASQAGSAQPATAAVTLTKLLYAVKLTADGDFFNVDAQMGAGTFADTTMSLKDIHFDFSVNHLHAPTLSALYRHMQDLNKTRLATPAGTSLAGNTLAATTATMQSMVTDILKLLPYSPELIVQHVGFATSDGDFKVTARMKLDGVTAVDIAPPLNNGALLKKLNLTADLSIATKLAAHFPFTSLSDSLQQQLATLEQRGYVTRNNDHLTMHARFKQGAFTVNGKPFGAN